MTQQQKIAAALMKAGISSPAAWSAAGMPAGGMSGAGTSARKFRSSPIHPQRRARHRRKCRVSGASGCFDPHPPVVLMKGTNNKTFLISWRSQQEVARSLGWKCDSDDLGRPRPRAAQPLLVPGHQEPVLVAGAAGALARAAGRPTSSLAHHASNPARHSLRASPPLPSSTINP